MAISFKCGGCGKQYTVKDELAGKRAQCKSCNTVMKVPTLTPAGEPDLHADSFAGGSVSGASTAGQRANDETVAGSLHAMSQESLAGRGSSAAGRTSPAMRPPPEPYTPPVDPNDPPPLSPLLHVPAAKEGAVDVNGDEPRVHVARGPAIRNRAPMEPFSFLLAIVMLGVLGYCAYAGYGAFAGVKGGTPDVLNEAGKPHLAVLGRYGVIAVMALAVVAPLMLGAWVAALKIINVRLPDGIYMRSIGLVALPVAMLGLWSTPMLAHVDSIGMIIALVGAGVAYALLHFVHAQKPAVAGITAGLGLLLAGGGLMAAQSAADSVAGPAEKDYTDRVVAIAKRRNDDRLSALANKPVEKPTAVTTDPQETAAKQAVDAVREQVDAFKAALAAPKQTREKTAAAAQALAQAVKAAKARYPGRPEWDSLSADIAAVQSQVAALPSAAVPADLAEAPPAGPDWSAKGGRHDVSAFAFNLTPPVDATLDMDTSSALKWQLPDSRATMVVEQATSAVPTQQRPWVAPAFIVDAAADKPFAVIAETTPVVEYGTINGLPASRIVVPDPGNAAEQTVVYTLHQGATWLKCTIGPVVAAADPALTTALQSVRTLHARAAGEPTVDPMPAMELVARYQPMPKTGERVGGDRIVQMLKAKPGAEDAVLKTLGVAPDDAALERYSPLLLATATEKSSRLLWRMAAGQGTTADAARDVLRTVEPKNADDFTFAMLDLKSTSSPQSKRGLNVLANADVDKEKLPAVAKALSTALDEPSFLQFSSGPVVEAALEKWMTDDIGGKLKAMLDKPATPVGDATLAMKVLGNTANKKYVFSICKWTETDAVTTATDVLIGMGTVAEAEVDKLLAARGDKATQVRRAAVTILDEIGTGRSLTPLQTCANQSGDAELRDAAKATMVKIRDRVKNAPAAAQPK